MKAARLRAFRAAGQGLRATLQAPWLLLGFSLSGGGLQLLGWGLLLAGDRSDSGVLAAVLNSAGLLLQAGSLLWLVEGLTRAGLALTAGTPLSRSQLYQWNGAACFDLLRGLVRLLACLALTALISFLSWSLVLLVAPAVQMVPGLLCLAAWIGLVLSQLFNPCLVLSSSLRPSLAFRQGFVLLEHHWGGLLLLSGLLLPLLLSPLLLGLLAEAARPGLGLPITALSLLALLPLLATCICAAYRQLEPQRAGRLSRSDR